MSDVAMCPACGFALQPISYKLTSGELIVKQGGASTLHGQSLGLTAGETTILHALLAAGGAVVKREALENMLGSDGYSNTIAVLIHRIRKSLRAIDPDFAPIETLHGHGWRWSGQ